MSHNKSLLTSPVLRFYKNRWQPEFTRYWIVRESELFRKISRLEAVGMIKILEEKIQKNKELQAELLRLHRKDLALRKELLHRFSYSDPIPSSREQEFLRQVLTDENIGLGGIRNWQKHSHIKCLHLWTAYHLGNSEFKNFIGAFVLENI